MSFERYTSKSGLKTRGRKGLNWKPRFYCDDTSWSAFADANKPYQAKLPVVHLSVAPHVNTINQDFTWDISESNSASSTIDTFCVSFTGSASEADIVDGDWSADPLTNTVNWPTAGDYVISATVTDILGVVSQVGSIMISVISFPSVVYVATEANGVYILDGATLPAAINTGLSGDNLKVYDLKIQPDTRYYPRAMQTVWITTVAGCAYTTNGGTSWTAIAEAAMGVPANDVADDPAPATAYLYQVGIEYGKDNAVYITRAQVTPDRLWVYKYLDGTWTNKQVGT